MGNSWTTWGGTYTFDPATLETPSTIEEISRAVKEASARGLRVKVPGTGHSFTDIAGTDGVAIRLDQYKKVVEADPSTGLVTVQGGITINELGDALAGYGLAMENLGDIGYQTISGAISTGTHGTGARFGNISTQIAAIELVLADGSTLRCSADEEAEVFKAARVGLGALGVISTVTLRCVRAFNLHSVEQPMRFDECLERIDQFVDSNEHFELYWFPHTDKVLTLQHNRTSAPARPRGAARSWIEDVLLENHIFGALCGLGKMRPRWIPAIARTVAKFLSRSVTIDRSDRVFTNPRYVRFVEMEYAVPREHGVEALKKVREAIDKPNLLISFPIELRFVAADDIFLSPSNGRETSYIAVHVYRGMEFEPYFREVEAIMRDFGGRPHWGKMHYQTAETLAPRYPDWGRFQAVRDRLDPGRVFENSYTKRVLG